MARVYRVLGMTCEGCAGAVSKAIQSALPRATVEVDLDAKTVTVERVDNDAAIGKAVESAGFEFAGPA